MTSIGTDKTIAAIRAVLAERELSQRGLARRLGWGRMRVQHLLNGHTRLTLTDLQAIAATLGVPVTRFLPTAERCPHGYHATEGHCPRCDLDRDGKCGPDCTHDHSEANRPVPGGAR